METIMLIHVQIVHKEMVLAGVMVIANGSMDSVNLKVCNPQSLKILNRQYCLDKSKVTV